MEAAAFVFQNAFDYYSVCYLSVFYSNVFDYSVFYYIVFYSSENLWGKPPWKYSWKNVDVLPPRKASGEHISGSTTILLTFPRSNIRRFSLFMDVHGFSFGFPCIS